MTKLGRTVGTERTVLRPYLDTRPAVIYQVFCLKFVKHGVIFRLYFRYNVAPTACFDGWVALPSSLLHVPMVAHLGS